MSVVACKVTEHNIEIAADSITVRGYTQSRGQNTNHCKLFEINDMVIGSVGTAEETSLFRLFAATRRPAGASEYAILEFLSEFSEWKEKKINQAEITNGYIVIFEGKAFALDQWLVEEILTYEAIGAGMDFALTALYLGHSAFKAVETAIELSIFCEAPVITVNKAK